MESKNLESKVMWTERMGNYGNSPTQCWSGSTRDLWFLIQWQESVYLGSVSSGRARMFSVGCASLPRTMCLHWFPFPFQAGVVQEGTKSSNFGLRW